MIRKKDLLERIEQLEYENELFFDISKARAKKGSIYCSKFKSFPLRDILLALLEYLGLDVDIIVGKTAVIIKKKEMK